MLKDTYRGNFYRLRDKTYKLPKVAYIFDCPHCEVVQTNVTAHGIKEAKWEHYLIVHPEHHAYEVAEDVKSRVDQLFLELKERVGVDSGDSR
jgi:hypothetical protein